MFFFHCHTESSRVLLSPIHNLAILLSLFSVHRVPIPSPPPHPSSINPAKHPPLKTQQPGSRNRAFAVSTTRDPPHTRSACAKRQASQRPPAEPSPDGEDEATAACRGVRTRSPTPQPGPASNHEKPRAPTYRETKPGLGKMIFAGGPNARPDAEPFLGSAPPVRFGPPPRALLRASAPPRGAALATGPPALRRARNKWPGRRRRRAQPRRSGRRAASPKRD